MNKEEYLAVQNQLLAMARVVRGIPLREFIQVIESAETVGPIMDPTLYRQASSKMSQIKCLALSLLAFQKEVEGCA